MKNTIKKLAVTATLLATIAAGTGAISINTAQAAEAGTIEQTLKINQTEKVAEFKSQKELKKLLKKYPVYSRDSMIKNFEPTFSNSNFSLNEEKYRVLNNNQAPEVDFTFDENNYSFKVNFAQSTDFLETNHLAGHNFSYTYELPEQFKNSEAYKKLEDKTGIKGYIVWNQFSGTYHIQAMQYTVKNGQLEIKFTSIGSQNYSQISMVNFEAGTKIVTPKNMLD